MEEALTVVRSFETYDLPEKISPWIRASWRRLFIGRPYLLAGDTEIGADGISQHDQSTPRPIGRIRGPRALIRGAASLLLCGVVNLPVSLALAAVAPCWDGVRNDLDGGGPDVVVGLPSWDLVGKQDAGAIAVFSNVAGRGEPNPSPAPTAQKGAGWGMVGMHMLLG